MSKPNKLLKKYLESLTKGKKDHIQLCKELRIHRKTEYTIRKKALSQNLIKMDDFGKYSLTLLGKASLRTAERPDPQISFTVQSQVVDYLGSESNIPSAKCTIQSEDAQTIKQLDAMTDASERFITTDGLWLPVNNTFLKASAATLVDTILDFKAQEFGLNTVLDQKFRKQFSPFNWHNTFPGFDFRRRYGKLAASTNFKVLIEYDGKTWSKKYDDGYFESKLAAARNRRNEDHNKFLDSDKSVLVDQAIGLIGRGTVLSERDLHAMRLFFSRDEVEGIIDNYLGLYKIEDNELSRKKLIGKGFDLGIFEIEKKILYHLKVNRSKQHEFRNLVMNRSVKNKRELCRNPSTYSNVSNQNVDDRYSDFGSFIDYVIHEMQKFHDGFFSLMITATQAFLHVQTSADKINKESDNKEGFIHNSFSEQSIADLIQELLRVFHNKMNLYVSRSISFWPNKINNRKDLDRINSIVFKKIAEMHRQLRQLLDPIYGGDFNGYLDTYALKKNSSSMDLQNAKRYDDPPIKKAIEAMQNSCRSLYEECQDLAHPEPLPLEINYKYNE